MELNQEETMTLDLFADAFGRAAENLPPTIAGLTTDQLAWRPAPGANPAGWLAWHLARVEDEQVADLVRKLIDPSAETVWEQGWRDRFALPYAADAHGYGMSDEQVDAFGATDPSLLLGYYSDVHGATIAALDAFDAHPGALDRVVDTGWDPPVTGAVRLVSVLDDVAQHVGQLAYLRHLIEAQRSA
ncbi:MAG TPA: DinB family protein [Candidatus Luteococcus avicola]|nr:DinB family protein [Candidatus Luteococcus avicola]